ncbi:glycerophosphodiester phosphodiesterase [Undibacterium sp. Jales W-56]|uniref:glycerophosphodiester phosphodiesterase n=1 Tax=Undibacterium sp. Jales W-56 TaxID=2897325 RepID=UPI0021D31E94|nr:glycerophosphodiester phosphodiesterase [Undibacterium sp. Jales W-56]MCU6435457.1 glycerophosphodiester phosphodiesterase [Undibacterium sp. Jales W-56]
MNFDRRSFLKTAALSGSILSLNTAGVASQVFASPARKVELFAHRGASALRPEHTLASYSKAIADGADYIEPDLVSTKDGILVARHEAILDETTDVSQRAEFASKRTTKTIDGRTHTGWFCDDFTLSELKSLRAIERLPKIRPQNTFYDGMFQVLTWDEIIDFAAAESATAGRLIGLIPELKHSTYFAKAGLPLEDRFLKSLTEHEYTQRCPLEIQSFEVTNLKYIRGVIGKKNNIRLMQLVAEGDIRPADVVAAGGDLSFGKMSSKTGLREIARYADVVAPPTRALIPLLSDGKLGKPSAIISDAHDAGLLVHTWTFRPENCFLAANFRDGNGDNARNEIGAIAEIRHYIEAGIDGFFSDDSAVGRKAIIG